jgi:hypothetical protein
LPRAIIVFVGTSTSLNVTFTSTAHIPDLCGNLEETTPN